MQPFADAKSSPVCSVTRSASMSARRSRLRPVSVPVISRDDAACQLARLIAHLKQALLTQATVFGRSVPTSGAAMQRPPVADNILSDALCRRKHLLRSLWLRFVT